MPARGPHAQPGEIPAGFLGEPLQRRVGVAPRLQLGQAVGRHRSPSGPCRIPAIGAASGHPYHKCRPAWMPNPSTEIAQSSIRHIWRDLSLMERDHKLEASRDPDVGFAEASFAWASGE